MTQFPENNIRYVSGVIVNCTGASCLYLQNVRNQIQNPKLFAFWVSPIGTEFPEVGNGYGIQWVGEGKKFHHSVVGVPVAIDVQNVYPRFDDLSYERRLGTNGIPVGKQGHLNKGENLPESLNRIQ